jgi:hypothetical protein
MSLSRTTASSFTRKFACTAGLIAGVAGVTAAQSQAALLPPPPPPAPVIATAPATQAAETVVASVSTKVSAALAVCPGQTFSQPFEALKDANYYTLVQVSQFDGPEEGWELQNGANVVEGTRPDGSAGGVLDLPSGAYAISPVVCVTLQYPTARAWVQNVEGAGGVTVGVYYAGVKSGPVGQAVGQLNARRNAGWELSAPFNVKPQLAGSAEGTREVRFIFANMARGSDFHVSGLYVDPRMS